MSTSTFRPASRKAAATTRPETKSAAIESPAWKPAAAAIRPARTASGAGEVAPEVERIGKERVAPIQPRSPQRHQRPRRVDGEDEPDRRERPPRRIDVELDDAGQPQDRGDRDPDADEDEEPGLAQRGEVLGLCVPVRVAAIRRTNRHRHGEEREQRGGEVGARVRSLGEEPETRAGQPEKDGDAASRSGLATILCNTHGSAGRERDYVRMLLERGVEGMLFISAEITDIRGRHSHYAKLLERGARLVFVNGGSEELDVTSVGVDERAAGRIATEHLVELGHERIGFVAGDEYALPTREKALGHRDALRAAQLTDGLVAHSSFTVGGGREALRELLAKPDAERPTAVICSSDLMAIGALQEAGLRGLDVPGELSIVGFDGIDASTWTNPPLTTVEQPIDEIARTAVEALWGQVARPSERQPSYVFRPRLRVGGTTAPPSSALATS